MDDQKFDELTKALGMGTTRRRVLAGMGGAAGSALLVGVQGAAARPGKGKGRGQTKVGLCHASDDGTYHFIRVGAPAAETHVAQHGDQLCPTDDPCNTYTTCDPTTGACTPTPVTDGAACTLTDGTTTTAGTCVAGTCTPTTTTAT
jgi:hypothetical protein